MLVGSACYGQDVSGITNKLTEIDRDNDGKIDVRIETAYRGKTRVMVSMSRRNQKGEMTLCARSYLEPVPKERGTLRCWRFAAREDC